VVVRDPSSPIKGAWISVDLFFALSGFLITQSVLAKLDLGDFLRRRFWRIAPAMVVFLAFYVAWSAAAPDAHQRMEWALAATTQWANVQGAIGAPFSPHIGHLWSLSAEVQFYVLWGICLWWLARRGVSRRLIVAGLVALFALSWIERALLVDGGTPWNRVYLAPDTRAAALFVGCLVGLAHAWGWLRARRTVAVLLVPSIAFVVWIVLELSFLDDRTYLWVLSAASLAWGVVVASAALRIGTPLRWLLESAPLVWLGRCSYSVYLWHLLLIHETWKRYPDDLVLVGAISLPLSIAVGFVSYLVVERPLLSSTSRARLRARFAGA
jgi:peptidoglycan/LPS O-acetylase OafA/YrhL